MDSVFFKLVIIALLLAIPIFFLYRKTRQDSPKYRQLKTYSTIAFAREEYCESQFKSTMLLLLTCGSHEQSTKSRSSYDNTYEQYSFIFNKVTELQEQVNASIAKLEANISLIIKELKNSSRLVNDAENIKILIEEIKSTDKIDIEVEKIDSLGFTKIERLRQWLPSISIFNGVMAGLLTILVIWFLILALGGAGTTLMSYVIVLIMLIIPLVILSALQSRVNIRNFGYQDTLIIEKITSILDNSQKLEDILASLKASNHTLDVYFNEIATINHELTEVLYKNSAYVKAARRSKALFKKEAYTEIEQQLVKRISVLVYDLRGEVAVSSVLG
ncbi:septal ring factor EnvC (AmiA/AmiB activator) [Psychrobacter sp. PL15]|uniref:hypothetical protein n=1 Tax=unclassified Psychrobacter TaxID=196806 RepID=UPI001AE2CEB9|nr:hypothetical protein [Psychrobacter sp. PL15]MEC5209313.1 septal ring factor EnvC (AmiA/AmiB activator) [Psychrobacter sp. PL15]